MMIRELNFIPSLGSSVWTLISVGICYFPTSFLRTDSDSGGFNILFAFINLPFFRFLIANGSTPENVSSFFFMNGTLQYGRVKFLGKGPRPREMIWSLRNFTTESTSKHFQFKMSCLIVTRE